MKNRMRRTNVILGLLILVLVFVIWRWFSSASSSLQEGFDQSLQDKVADRMNPLAGQTNPLANPAVPIGIAESAGAALQSMMQSALNVGTIQADGTGSFNEAAPLNPTSVRVDNENSMLGLVKMCKERGVGDSPFGDPAFAQDCGMCLSSGTLITGESFSQPTGVLVYKADKDAAVAEAAESGYKFPQAIPSVRAATCAGASKSSSGLPVLALNQKDYIAFKKRKACRDNHTVGNECGICVSNKEGSWVPEAGGIQATNLWLWGAGTAEVTLGGAAAGQGGLSETKPLAIELGRVMEGTAMVITVLKGATVNGPYLYGAITSNGGKYKLPIEKFLDSQRRTTPKYFSEIKTFCARHLSQPNKDILVIKGFMPLTFVESDQLAAYDCPSSAFVTTQASADLFVTDPCMTNPKGQGPGNYSDACIRKVLLDGGCSTDGGWYKNVSLSFPTDFTIEKMVKWVRGIIDSKLSETDPSTSMGCRGIDISTPCDRSLYGGTITKECLSYLYNNESEKNGRIGRAYKNAALPFTSGSGTTTFCRAGGSLNPQTSAGEAQMRQAAAGYKGQTGLEAVKMFLSDVFTKATSNLDVNIGDDKGGSRDSWAQCFGIKVADPTLTHVSKNSINDVIDKRQSCAPLPSRIELSNAKGNKIGVVNATGNYILSFEITPRAVRSSWASIIHFSKTNGDWSDGSRCPAIWFFPGSLQLHVRIGDYNGPNMDNYGNRENGWNWGIDTEPIPMGQKSSIRLECKDKIITLTVNSKIYKATQPGTRINGAFHVYAGNPWYEPANALMENLCYTIL